MFKTISEEYRALNAQLHRDNYQYGTSGHLYREYVEELTNTLGTKDILDYGCGRRTLEKGLGYSIKNYDPAIDGLKEPPKPADIVICTDVLEHIEPEFLDNVLQDLVRVTQRVIFLSIATGPANKTLADGRNAHLIQQPWEWWDEKLGKYFRFLRMFDVRHGFVYVGQSYRDINETPIFDHIGPPPSTKRIQMKSAYTNDQRCQNIRSAMLRNLPAVRVLPPHDNKMLRSQS